MKRNQYINYQKNKLKKLNYNPKIMEVNISNGRVLDRGVMMISENPIAIISANKR